MPRIPPDKSVHLPISAGNATMETLFRVMAHRPAIMQHAMEMLEATMREGTVNPQLKELLAIRVSQVNQCFY